MFDCAEYCSEFVVAEKSHHEVLTDKMSIFVFELGKLPEKVDSSNILELFLRLFRADTEEEMERLEKLGVDEMTQMVSAYREIATSSDYVDLERKRVMNRLDEGQALHQAKLQGKAEADEKWEGVVAEKEAIVAEKEAALAEQAAALADKDAEIARLRAQLNK
jgi:hypothetical protein